MKKPLKSAHRDKVEKKDFGLYMAIEYYVEERCGGYSEYERYICEWRIYEDGTIKYDSIAVSSEESIDLRQVGKSNIHSEKLVKRVKQYFGVVIEDEPKKPKIVQLEKIWAICPHCRLKMDTVCMCQIRNNFASLTN